MTFTAGVEKIWHPDPRIGFLAQANFLSEKYSDLCDQIKPDGIHSSNGKDIAEQLPDLRKQWFNMILDACVAGTFLVLVSAIILLSVREWVLLLSRRQPAVLHETAPVWLPDYAAKETGPNLRTAAGAAALAIGLAKELSGESHFERARQQACECARHSDKQIFAQATEDRFNGVRRCC